MAASAELQAAAWALKGKPPRETFPCFVAVHDMCDTQKRGFFGKATQARGLRNLHEIVNPKKGGSLVEATARGSLLALMQDIRSQRVGS